MATEALPFTLTNESITVVYEGKPHVVQKGTPHFNALRKAIIAEDWKAVPKNLTIAKSIKDWAKGKFTLKGDNFSFEGTPIPNNINSRIIEMATKGEDPTPLFKFWERLQKNPSMRSVQQLWPFLEHKGIPLTKDGKFLAYKGVKDNFKDKHTGTVDNKPGVTNKMPRNQISDDPNEACHFGYHVGALSYAKSFAERVVVCEVDPENVVCVPYDSSQEKMRVCEYTVRGNHNGELLPSTTFAEETSETEETEATEAVEENDYSYDPANDFLAEPCEECDAKMPAEYLEEECSYHDVTCSKYSAFFPEDDTSHAVKAEKPKKPIKGKDKKKAHTAKKKAGKKLAKSFDRLNKAGMADLLMESLDTLRDYAGKGLKIVGASKVPGGKTALVSLILKTRG